MKVYKGDLLLHFADYSKPIVSAIAHVCNCQGVMGSGVALAIKTRYPEAYNAYKLDELKYIGGLPLGTMSFAEIRPGKHIYNLHAQDYYGNDGRRYLNYEALYVSLERVCKHMNIAGLETLGVPFKMGSDRAGGNWSIVQAMVSAVCKEHEIEVIGVSL
jgi:O-acetyl-ADP-ribose deacetylase (regulator of RNase III)